jgi:thiamine-monophosphate kinase
VDKDWLERFSKGLFDLATRYHVDLVGGDITKGPLTITIQAHGTTPKGKMIKRSTAKAGDLVYLTENVGEALLGLRILQQKVTVKEASTEYFIDRLQRPTPRLNEGIALRDIANSAIDISDGLLADLNHILTASNLGAMIDIDKLPIDNFLEAGLTKEHATDYVLKSGDDYELCFTIPKDKIESLTHRFKKNKLNCICIGEITKTCKITLQQSGVYLSEIHSPEGHMHFS